MNMTYPSWLTGLLIGSLTACQITKPLPSPTVKPTTVQIYQKWKLQRGNRLNNYKVMSGLGDVAIEVGGKPIYAPMNGETEVDRTGCVLFAGTELPAYLFRFCGIQSPKVGLLRKGEVIGTADLFVFATLMKQQNGTWAFVEPSPAMVEQTLKRS